MGCGAAKEAVEEPHHAPGQHEPKQDKEKDEAAAEIIDDRPPLLKQQIFEVFNAGSVRPNVPPLYLPADAGPFVTREKTPSQAHSMSRILVSGDLPPPRILDEPAAAMMKSPTLHLESDGVLLRAFLPHSLSAYCVGCCRPDLAAGQLTPGFRYDVEVEGAADERAIAQSKPSSRDPSQRRRVLLFPSSIDAVGLYVTVNGIGKSNRIVAPYRANCTASPEVEPIDGAFATFSLLTHSRADDDRASFDSAGATSPRGRTAPAVLASRQSRREIGTVLTPSSTVFAESSLAFSLLPRPSGASKDGNDVAAVERRLPDDAVTPARASANGALASTRGARRDSFNSGVEAAFASALCGLEDGVHTVSLALRFRYVTDTFVAVYDKPPPVAGTTGMRTVGTYVAHTVTSSAADQLSDVIAGGDFTIVMDSSGRAHLTDLCRAA